jgi:DNA-binding ferritin-like protein
MSTERQILESYNKSEAIPQSSLIAAALADDGGLGPYPIGGDISGPTDLKSTELLHQLLVAFQALALETTHVHWNYQGINFMSVHPFLGDEYDTLLEETDTIAEHIRAIGQRVSSTANLPNYYSDLSKFDHQLMLTNLHHDNDVVIKSLDMINKIATDEPDNAAVIDLVGQLSRSRKKFHYKLGSILGVLQ